MASVDIFDSDVIVARYKSLGIGFEAVAPDEVERLRSSLAPMLGQSHAYFSFLRELGLIAIDGPFGMLGPKEVLEALSQQRSFYDNASFGDRPEDVQNMEREQAFRSTLIPFQFANSKGDFYCFVSSNRRAGESDPLILDVFHDDFELAGLEDPDATAAYTRSFAQHLDWVADVLALGSAYPPES